MREEVKPGTKMPNGTIAKGNHGNGSPWRASKERRRVKRAAR
jgi:hypothetical protein